jgi:hypothetical protein
VFQSANKRIFRRMSKPFAPQVEVFGGWLLVFISCWLLAFGCWFLLAVGFWLLAVGW